VHAKVLNALPKSVNKEAEIIAQAGLPRTSRDSGAGASAVTIATSIAGRGTDIRLGGDPQGIMKMALRDLYLKDMLEGELSPPPGAWSPRSHAPPLLLSWHST